MCDSGFMAIMVGFNGLAFDGYENPTQRLETNAETQLGKKPNDGSWPRNTLL